MTSAARTLIGIAVVAAAGAGGYFAYRHLDTSGSQTLTQAPLPAPGSQPLPASGDPGDAEAAPERRVIPDRLPEVTLADREGKARRLSEWSDRPLLINFWATWCAPCRREIPLLKSLRAERQAQRLEVIGIAVDFREAVLDYAREIGLDYPLLIGEQDGLDAAAAFGMDLVLPFSIFSDRQGRIVTVKVGELHADEAAFILDRVREIDAGQLPLDAAQERIAAQLKQLAAARAGAKLEPIAPETAGN